MSKRNFAFAFSLVGAIVAAGCATKAPPAPVAVVTDDAAISRMASAADRASISMQRLAAIRTSTHGIQVTSDFKTPEGLDKPISLTWSGPVDEVTKKIAELTGYEYMGAHGRVPSTPVLISISVSGVPAFNVLANAGAQAGSAADIVVNPDAKRMYIKYPPVTRTGGYAVGGSAK